MFDELELSHNETKNICYAESEGAVDQNTIIRCLK